MEWLALGPPQTEAPNYKVGSPPLSWQPLTFLSLSLSLFALLRGNSCKQSFQPARRSRNPIQHSIHIYIYVYISLSFLLSAGLRGHAVTLRPSARPTTPCVYGVAGFGAPSD